MDDDEGELEHPIVRDKRLPPGEDLVWLGDRPEDEMRRDGRAGHLVCPSCDLGYPGFHPRSGRQQVHDETGIRPQRRFHFVHKRGDYGPHASQETLEHRWLLQELRRWVHRRYPSAEVLDLSQSPLRVVTSEDDGELYSLDVRLGAHRHALIIQTSPLSAEAWRVRDERYRAAGFKTAWFFAAMPALREYDTAGRLTLSEAECAVFLTTFAMRWLLLDTNGLSVETAWVRPRIARNVHRPYVAKVVPDDLDDCRLTSSGFVAPHGDRYVKVCRNNEVLGSWPWSDRDRVNGQPRGAASASPSPSSRSAWPMPLAASAGDTGKEAAAAADQPNPDPKRPSASPSTGQPTEHEATANAVSHKEPTTNSKRSGATGHSPWADGIRVTPEIAARFKEQRDQKASMSIHPDHHDAGPVTRARRWIVAALHLRRAS